MNGKPNGVTTMTSSDWDEWLKQNDPNYMTIEEEDNLSRLKNKFNNLLAYKFGASSQNEEDLINNEFDNYMNDISKGEIDPATSFMQYIDMILGRNKMNRGGIISVI